MGKEDEDGFDNNAANQEIVKYLFLLFQSILTEKIERQLVLRTLAMMVKMMVAVAE